MHSRAWSGIIPYLHRDNRSFKQINCVGSGMLDRKKDFTKILCMILLLGGGRLFGQVVLEIGSLPGNTPINDTLYVTGNFNDWEPGEHRYHLLAEINSHIRLDIPTDSFPIQYKITRGDWDNVEGDAIGNAIPNRILETPPLKDSLIHIEIASWEDLPPESPLGEVHIIVTEIPANTPPDAPLYIVGNFNSWHPGDPKYRMEQGENGTYYMKVPMIGELLEFKFCRGNWETAEGRRNGRARYNREYEYNANAENIVYAEIETWEDISGNPINTLTFIWLLAGVLGVLLIVAINTLQNNNVAANRVLSVLILLISISLFARVAVYDREIFQHFPKLILVPDIILFLYAPVFILYLRGLLWAAPLRWKSGIWIHFIPFFIHLAAWIPLFLLENSTFISQNTDLGLRPWFVVTGGIAWVYNAFYWFYGWRLINIYRKTADNNYAYEENLSFLRAVMGLMALCLLIWLGSYVIGGLDLLIDNNLESLTERSQDLLYIVFSLTVFCLGYFAIREPEIFKMSQEVEPEPAANLAAKANENEPGTKEWEGLKIKLKELMEREQPYLNPKLTLSALSEMMGTNVHTLSKVVNDGFGVNFNDFINGYRVEEFKSRVVEEKYKHHTFLSIALMAGFNSKTAFNRSFKKITQMTPGEYLKGQEKGTS